MGSLKIIAIALTMGSFLLTAYTRIAAATTNYTTDSSLARANLGLFTMGIIFIVSAVSLKLCELNCGPSESTGGSYYTSFFLFLSIVLIGLAATIVNGIDSSGSGKTWAVLTLVLGIFMLLGCIGMIVWKIQKLKRGGLF